MQQLLVANVFRGADSTGIFGVNKHGNVKMAKEACSSPFFIGKKDSKDIIDDMISKYHVMVGHNRKSTMGATIDENAHPFIEDHIILVHNGTLTNHRKLADTTVDSHAICKSIATDGYKHMLKNIEGAYALIWYDALLKTVFFTRNAERPLALVETEDRIYLASEGKMLEWILERNDIKKFTVQNVPTGKVFKFNLETRKLEVETPPKKDKPARHHQMQMQQEKFGQDNKSHLSLVPHSSNNSSTPSLEELAEAYDPGDWVPFEVKDFELYNHGARLDGVTLDGNQLDVFCWLDKNVPTSELDSLVNSEVVIGKVTSIYHKPGKSVRLHMKDPKPTSYIKFKNGVQMTRHEFDQYGGGCYMCGTHIQDSDVESTTVTMTKGKISNIVCEHCMADFHAAFPIVGGMMC